MEQFKGTPAPWNISIIHGVCLGVEAQLGGGYSQMIVNTILPDTDRQYAKEKHEIIANANLIAAAPELLMCLINLNAAMDNYWNSETKPDSIVKMITKHQKLSLKAINKALNINHP